MSKEYEIVIGLEVHVELNTKTKIFCGCSTAFGGEPNTHVCPVCSGMPGSLPVLNKAVVEKAIAAFKENNKTPIETIDVYVKPEENVAYYVINGEGSDDYKIEL